ncbi:MAG: hypothetical protein ACRD8O_12075 [Bryobacteraceae bacterium]
MRARSSIQSIEATPTSSLGGPFAKRLKGDLDNIIQMEVRRDPDRRYASVDHFADDLRRIPIASSRSARTKTPGTDV